MKLSRFNVIAKKDSENRCLFYNTFSDSQVLCDDKNSIELLLEKIKQNLQLNSEEQELAETFLDLGFLIDDQVDEKEKFLNWFDTKIRNDYRRLSTLLVTSRTCNLRCPYCFEKDVLDKGLNMKMDTAIQVVEFLKKRIDKFHPEVIDITFFGGEPLMNIPVLKFVMKEMHDFCESRKVKFEPGIITNGVMLTPALVLELKQWSLRWIKITIDGDKDDHDKLRVTASGKGTFDRIWTNLVSLKGLIPVYIGGNFDERNEKSLQQLIDKLAEAEFKENLFSVEFKPIQKLGDRKGVSKKSEVRTNCTAPAFDANQVTLMSRTREYLRKKNIPTQTQIGIGPCELHRRSFFGIDMNGNLYKCSAMVGKEGFASGDVWLGPDEEKVIERIGEGIRPWKDCGDCPFIPVCAGGCKAIGFERYGDFTVGSCDKLHYYERVREMFERNLKEEVAYDDGLQYETINLDEHNKSFVTDDASIQQSSEASRLNEGGVSTQFAV